MGRTGESSVASRGWVGKTGPDALLMKEIVARTRDSELPRDVAAHELFYPISHLGRRLLRGGTFQDAECK